MEDRRYVDIFTEGLIVYEYFAENQQNIRIHINAITSSLLMRLHISIRVSIVIFIEGWIVLT